MEIWVDLNVGIGWIWRGSWRWGHIYVRGMRCHRVFRWRCVFLCLWNRDMGRKCILSQVFKQKWERQNSDDFLHYNSIIIFSIHNALIFSSYSIIKKEYIKIVTHTLVNNQQPISYIYEFYLDFIQNSRLLKPGSLVIKYCEKKYLWV